MLHCVNWKDDRNLGDRFCSPALYYDALPESQHLKTFVKDPQHKLILGGGGVMLFKRMMELTVDHNTALWGVGTNNHKNAPDAAYDYSYLQSSLCNGVRDWFDTENPVPNYRWVPCVSSKHSAFDTTSRHPTRDVVLFQHFEISKVPAWVKQYPTMSASHASFEEALAFMGSAHMVITNSYHGAYWATLLGKRVVVYPFSSKFYHFKHKPVIASWDDSFKFLWERATTYPQALEECRQANDDYFNWLGQQGFLS